MVREDLMCVAVWENSFIHCQVHKYVEFLLELFPVYRSQVFTVAVFCSWNVLLLESEMLLTWIPVR